jgi:hypothetical protein
MNSISNMNLSRFLCVACKSLEEKDCPWAKTISNGESCHVALCKRLEAARTTIPESKEEKLELRKILKHRKKLADYSIQTYRLCLSPGKKELMQTLVKKIFQDIATLSSHQKFTRTSFCFPAGTDEHIVCCEIARETNGTHSFLIYNKGDGTENTFFHSSLSLKKGNRTIARTRVQICNLSQTDFTPAFIEGLFKITIRSSKSMDGFFNHIKRHLLDGKSSFIHKPYWERQWEERGQGFSQQEHMQMVQSLSHDPDFHSLQTMGTCLESNMQTPEHFLASRALRLKLKLASLKHCASFLTSQLEKSSSLKQFYLEKTSYLESKLLAIK